MSRVVLMVSLFAWLLLASTQAFPSGQGDHPLVGRYEGSELVGYKDYGYDEARLLNGPFAPGVAGAGAPGWMHVEGNISLYYYKLPADRSTLEVLRNYETSLKAKGFNSVFRCATSDSSCYLAREGHGTTNAPYDFALALDESPELPRLEGDYIRNYFSTNARYLLARLIRPEGTIYASINLAEGSRGNFAFVRVVEAKAMETDRIGVVGAGQMQQALADSGRISLYGIYFDFDKDIVKPESKPTLDEISRLLASDPGLRIAIVGHTDAQGSATYNLELSRRRAANVAANLAHEYAIDPGRMTSRGAGASEPIASNDTDEGRARNRRVELVRR